MKANFNIYVLGTITFILSACGGSNTSPPTLPPVQPAPSPPVTVTKSFKFVENEGWISDFADLPAHIELGDNLYQLDSGYEIISDVNTAEPKLFLHGNNRSDDLFMFAKISLNSMASNTTYQIDFDMEIASNVGEGCVGAGGSPGEALYVKVGATTKEPEKEIDAYNEYRMTIDKGNQSTDGADMILIGNFATDRPCDLDAPYILKSLTSDQERFLVSSDNNGNLWIIVGTDSAFEGISRIYYDSLTIIATPQ